MRTGRLRIPQSLDDRYGRFQSRDNALQLVHRVHLERVYREVSRALNIAHRDFSLGPAGNGRGLFHVCVCPRLPGGAFARKDAGSCGSILDPILLLTW